jgi:hypothetical protein
VPKISDGSSTEVAAERMGDFLVSDCVRQAAYAPHPVICVCVTTSVTGKTRKMQRTYTFINEFSVNTPYILAYVRTVTRLNAVKRSYLDGPQLYG